MLETEKAAFAALSLVELAGLEPATSWVRFRRQASPLVAIVRRLQPLRVGAARSFAICRHRSSALLDQNLTTDGGRLAERARHARSATTLLGGQEQHYENESEERQHDRKELPPDAGHASGAGGRRLLDDDGGAAGPLDDEPR